MAPKKRQKIVEAPVAAAPVEDEVVQEEAVPEIQIEGQAALADNETEKDAAKDSRAKLKEPVRFLTADTTPNVVPSAAGNILLAAKDGGLNHLCAGARGSVGVKTGRYAFEVKVVEAFGPADHAGGAKVGAIPKSLLRVGFSTRGSGLLLGTGKDNVCFDEAGSFVYDNGPVVPSATPKKSALMFSNHASVVIVLNLDEKSPNFNTISFFHDGKRVTNAEPLPDALKGQVLYPTVTYKSATVHANFTDDLQIPLPFKCHMIGDGAAADVVVTEEKEQPLEVVFPVFLPDKGTFDWADWFLKENAGRYSELSDRALLEWGLNSGLKNHAKTPSSKHSSDQPDMSFNITGLDDGTARDQLVNISSLQNRSYVVMEVRNNLLKEERMAALKKWRYAPYKKVAQVMMGIPEEGFRMKIMEIMLADKQAKLDKVWEAEKLQKFKKKAAARAQKQVQVAMKKAARIRKKMEEERKKKQEAERVKEEAEAAAAEAEAVAAAEAEAAGEAKDEEDKDKEGEATEEGKAEEKAKPEEVKEEEEKKPEVETKAKEEEEEKAEEEEEEEVEDEEMDDEDPGLPPQASLTPVELQTFFRKLPLPDLTEQVVSAMFSKATLPDMEEGFDEVRFTWSPESECDEQIRRWVVDRKLTSKIEDLKPSDWFRNKFENWQKDLQAWHVKHMEHKDPSKKTKDGSNPFAKAPPGQPPKMSPPSMSPPSMSPPGSKPPTPVVDMEVDDDKDPVQALEEELDREEIDIFGLENINSIDGDQTPLFSNFAFEDWALLSLRFELHLLVHSFRRDANDPERTGIHPEHLAFYYNKYYKKALNPKNYGVDTVDDLIDLIKDTALADAKSKVVESMVSDDLESNDIFVKLTEENRRDRARRIDAGDESAKLKFSRPAAGGAANMAATAPPANGIVQSKAGGMQRPPVTPGNLGQKVKASGGAPAFAPKQTAWGNNQRPPMQQQGMRPWGGGMNMGKGNNMMGAMANQWSSFFGGGGGNNWKGGW